jgi:hypothetical protein
VAHGRLTQGHLNAGRDSGARNQNEPFGIKAPASSYGSRLDGDGLQHRLYQEPLKLDPLRVPQLLQRLVGGRDADEGAVSEAVGESQLRDMELGVELVAAPAVAGLVQVSADVEIDQALPTRPARRSR